VSKYELIEAEKANYPITRMVDLLGVARSGYYKWTQRVAVGPTARQARQVDLRTKIIDAHGESNGVYGAPRILADLREAGEVVSVKTVAKLMREAGVAGISPATWHPVTTTSDGAVHTIPDLVGRVFDRGGLDEVWTSDITYLHTGEGWLYLCAVRDGCSRRVLGWAIAETLHTDVVERALRRAVTMRGRAVDGVIFHADRGSQYTSDQLAQAAEEVGARVSMGRTGVCWDNAQIESFWSTLKHEYYNRQSFATKHEAHHGVGRWIEETYNRRRRHSSIGMISPVAFEELNTPAAEAA
jgi:transposase InsO family protein